MANTYTLIASATAGSGGSASFDFTSIPSTYTDLVLKWSVAYNGTGNRDLYVSLNSSTTSFSNKYVEGTGSAAAAGSVARYLGTITTTTANTFTSGELYLPNYLSSNNKSFSSDNTSEANATTAYATLAAGLWSNTAAITAVSIAPSAGSFIQYSTAYLYGIKNS